MEKQPPQINARVLCAHFAARGTQVYRLIVRGWRNADIHEWMSPTMLNNPELWLLNFLTRV